MPDFSSVIAALVEMGPFQYRANHGNIGDLFIDVATRQLFLRCGLHPQNGPHHHLVYGGGGRFVPFYGSLDKQKEELTAPSVERCIILPHSFYQADSFVRALDGRHLVFCREQRSLDYCRSLNKRAQFLPADDMALHFNPAALLKEVTACGCRPASWVNDTEKRLKTAVQESSFTIFRKGIFVNAAFLPRRGDESVLPEELLLGQDLSDLWNGWGDGTLQQAFLIQALLSALSELDILISDRLHICIAGLFAGCHVFLLDNNYGKLSGVYQQSLQWHPRARQLSLAELSEAFPEIFPETRNLSSPPVFCRHGGGTENEINSGA